MLKTAAGPLTCCILLALCHTRAPEFEQLVVFGDSLSDNGHRRGDRTRPYRRCTNGPVWAELLGARMGIPAPDVRAQGGATSGEVLARQVQPYLTEQGGALPRGVLYVVWAGGVDLLSVRCVDAGPRAVERAVEQVVTAVKSLVDAGARRVLVPNLPDLGGIPRSRRLGAARVAAVSRLTRSFNARLHEALERLAPPGVVTTVDFHRLLERVRARPGEYGLHNVADPANDAAEPVDVDGYLFWDPIHPTAAGHRLLGCFALRCLAG